MLFIKNNLWFKYYFCEFIFLWRVYSLWFKFFWDFKFYKGDVVCFVFLVVFVYSEFLKSIYCRWVRIFRLIYSYLFLFGLIFISFIFYVFGIRLFK